MNKNTTYALLSEAPFIRRARGFRLYTEDGRRLVDLWQDGGRALLGHTPAGAARAFKNTAARGLLAALPSRAGGRFCKALKTLFPAMEEALFLAEMPAAGLPLWRPFSAAAAPPAGTPLCVPVLPSPLAPLTLVVMAGGDARAAQAAVAAHPPSPFALAAASWAVYSLLAEKKRGRETYPRVEAALRETARLRRDGVYVYPAREPDAEAWRGLFALFLKHGFLLPPCPGDPLIIPGELSKGEEAALAGLLRQM